ncbi:MAG: GlsB/YeaQ/YmgE family stress response membrane protein [Caulobacteraceae bacterium]|nr:GlsB/YeaQ/YmgE family stress response membrane protein [Caulobacteraceae bacterium]
MGVGLIGTIIIGILAGWIAEKIMKRDHGLITNLVVGILGALLGKFLIVDLLNFSYGGWIASLAAAVVGAVILLFLLGLMKRR